MSSKYKQFAAKRKAAQRNSNFKGVFARFKNQSSKNKKRSSSQRPNKRTNNKNTYHKPDFYILVTTIVLTLFGWIMIYSGSFYLASQRADTLFWEYNPFHFFILQGGWIVASVIVAIISYYIPMKIWKLLGYLGLIIVFSLLIIVLILPYEINGAKLWIPIGPFTLQPSEFAKPMIILTMAGVLSGSINYLKEKELSEQIKKYAIHRVTILIFCLLPIVGLVLAGRDLATAGLISLIGLVIFFMSDNSSLHNLSTGLMVIFTSISGLWFTVSEPYRLQRLTTYLDFLTTGNITDPLNSGYQLRQILIAVATGSWFGYGFGQSRQKYFYLQETAFTDTIFAVIAEEFGLIGSLLTIIGFMILILRGIKIAQNAPNKFQALTAIGIVSWFFIQTIIHLGVNVGLIPLTGMTLPFLSYGGSSLLASAIGIGILLNISKQVKLE